MPRLTLIGRALALITGELLFTAAVWAIAAVFLRETPAIALLAWTVGLRHGLDADHISAIDNATRGLLAHDPPHLSVLCGLWFSLGHSTIVIVVNVAIAVSVDVYDKLDKVGSVGGIVGAAVSASFLFLIGLANSIILYGIIRRRRRARDGEEEEEGSTHTVMMRILGPVTRFVDRPWKMYPVGVLFGFGFDTASSIALLAITAVAQQKVHHAAVAILPFLFTAGMSLVDSLDSVLMVYSYAGFPEAENRFKLIEGNAVESDSKPDSKVASNEPSVPVASGQPAALHAANDDLDVEACPPRVDQEEPAPTTPGFDEVERAMKRVKINAMSNLSIVLTIMSILVAFSISLITTMGLIGENCKACREAAESDPGLPGRWWRAWAAANDQSGYIGAGIVAAFLLLVVAWYATKYYVRRRAARS